MNYLDKQQCIDRLLHEWKRYSDIVIAIDFDNTIYDYHNQGLEHQCIIDLIKKCQQIGCWTMIFTANDDNESFIRQHCTDIGIRVDSINENAPFVPFNTKKPFYNILLDDRSGLGEAYEILNAVANTMLAKKKVTNIVRGWVLNG